MEGNKTKIREALVQCELFLGNVSRHGHPTLNPGDKCTACEGVDELRGMVVSALSSPARNCDLEECSTDDGVISAHERFCKSWHSDGKTCSECPYYNTKTPMMTCRERWLLAPATGRKGDVK